MCCNPVADKSEAPTPKRLREARLRGQVAKSPLLVFGALTGVTGLFVETLDPEAWGALLEPAAQVARGESFEAARASIVALLLEGSITRLAPLLSILVLGAIAMTVAQTGPVFAPKALDARSGLGRIGSQETLVSLLKAHLVLVALLVVVALTLREMLAGVGTLSMRPAAFTLATLIHVLAVLFRRCSIAMLALGILDLLHRRKALMASLAMTRAEVLLEQRSQEGDPEARVERDRRGRERGGDPLDAILTADLILWSDERFLVGLAYDRERGEGSPRIVVRGRGDVALTLRDFAHHHGIHEEQSDVLAKRMFGLDEVPEDAFEAVAAALHRAWSARPETRADL